MGSAAAGRNGSTLAQCRSTRAAVARLGWAAPMWHGAALSRDETSKIPSRVTKMSGDG